MSRFDDARNRRLLFARELASGDLRPSQLARREVRAATATQRVPAAVVRRYQERLVRRGRLSFEARTEPRYTAARRAVLGGAAAGPPRVLVRLGVVPATPSAAFTRATALLTDAGVPHLVAVPSAELDAGGADRLADLRRAGVELAGCGDGAPLPAGRGGAIAVLDAADAALAAAAVRPAVFVAPGDRLPWRAWDALSGRYDVVCGGTGCLRTLGWHDGPAWRADAVWAPAYAPLDGHADEALRVVERLRERGSALWVPVALDWQREAAEGFGHLRRFAAGVAGLAVPWEELLAEVRFSRTA